MDATTVMIESDFCRALHLSDGAHGVMIYPEHGCLRVEVWQADTKLASFNVAGAYLAELIDMATSAEAQTMGAGECDDV